MKKARQFFVPADQLDFEEGRWYVLTVTAMGAGE